MKESRARAYLAKLPRAIAGQGGHAATFTAACRLVEFGLSFNEALPLLSTWNETHCQPRWTQTELRHKLADAFKRTSPKPQFASGVVYLSSAPQRVNQNETNKVSRDRSTPKPRRIRPLATVCREGTVNDLTALAALRGLSVDGIALASARGLLRFGRYHGTDAWFVLDTSRRNACARRMDGNAWLADGTKSFILCGAQAAWPVGVCEARQFPKVLLCEGAPDLLAAFHFIISQDCITDYAPVAMLSAVYRIPADALPLFAGKCVRIFAHDDATGYEAAARWTTQLNPYTRNIDTFSFRGVCTRDGSDAKDLNGFALREVTAKNEKLAVRLLP